MKLKKKVEQESVKVGLNLEDVIYQSRWIFCVNEIASRLRGIWPICGFMIPPLLYTFT